MFYARTAESVRTAPTIRQLLREAGLPRALDPAAAAASLCGERAAGATLFRGIRVVPPGHELVVSVSSARPQRRWDPPLYCGDADATTLEEAARELWRRLRESVVTHGGCAGEPTACALSGGIDSGALLALLVEAGIPVRALILADDFADDGEVDRARAIAAHLGLAPMVVCVSEEELPGAAVDAVRACGDMIWNGRAVASYLFYRRVAAAGATRVLSGIGADEVLCGHPQGLLSFMDRLSAEHDLARSLLRAGATAAVPPRGWPASPPGVDALVWRQHVYLTTVMPDSTLPPERSFAAAAGLDLRLPYLDPCVAEFALRLPPSLRARGATGKLVLREALRGLLPDEVRGRPKTPRLAPAGGRTARAREQWLAFYDEWLCRPRLEALWIVEPGRTRALLDDYRSRSPDDSVRSVHDAVLMRLASLAILHVES